MVNVLRTEVIESLYTLDLGNGFSKRKFNDKGLVEVDSSVIAQNQRDIIHLISIRIV